MITFAGANMFDIGLMLYAPINKFSHVWTFSYVEPVLSSEDTVKPVLSGHSKIY